MKQSNKQTNKQTKKKKLDFLVLLTSVLFLILFLLFQSLAVQLSFNLREKEKKILCIDLLNFALLHLRVSENLFQSLYLEINKRAICLLTCGFCQKLGAEAFFVVVIQISIRILKELSDRHSVHIAKAYARYCLFTCLIK